MMKPGNASRSTGGLRRNFSSVSVDGITQNDSGRVKRVKVLNQEQREAIQNLTCASQLTHAERKRQWGALHRKLEKKETLPPGVLAKWERATTPQEKPDPQYHPMLELIDAGYTIYMHISVLTSLSGLNS